MFAQVVACNSFENLSKFVEEKIQKGYTVHCVETEFGDKTLYGNGINLNHHGNLCYNPAPCIIGNLRFNTTKSIVCLSHIDLDAVAGTLAILGKKPMMNDHFWEQAEMIDVYGPHILSEKWEKEFAMWWSWAEKNPGPRIDSSIQDVTSHIKLCAERLEKMNDSNFFPEDHEEMLQEARDFLDSREELERKSRRDMIRIGDYYVVTRVADKFVNHLYKTADGKIHHIIIAFNSLFGSITLSFERKLFELEAREIVQMYPEWGCDPMLAGGKDLIAGSPREKNYTSEDFDKFVKWFLDGFLILSSGCRII